MNSRIQNILKIISFILIIFGIMTLSGSLMPKNMTENKLGDLFDIISTPLVFFLLPLLCLKLSLKMNIKNWIITTITLIVFILSGIAQFGQTYNYFISYNENIDKNLENIMLVYEKKLALLPTIKSSSKEYNEYESNIINRIIEGRMRISRADNSPEKIGALKNLSNLNKELSINIENYPNLKSVKLFTSFIETTKDIEEEVRESKARYNEQVNAYNKSCKMFPHGLIAKLMHFKERKYFSKI